MQQTSEKSDVLISSSAYYREMQVLALAKRTEHKVETASLDLPFIKKIYKAEGIKIDYLEFKSRKIRAAYFCDEGDYSVALNKTLPRAPKLFSLAHELKHHYADQQLIQSGQIKCGDYNAAKTIEIGAEVFAAEFIYPENEMRALAEYLGINSLMCNPKKVVEFKRTCPAHISFTFILKRFERFGFIQAGEYSKIQFQKLEEEMYGLPIYKQEWFKKRRARKKNN